MMMNGTATTSATTYETMSARLLAQNNSVNNLLEEHEHFGADEMLESEKTSLVGRVQDLERRVMEQQDEIVYLKSTLSDVLRRLSMLDGGGGFERAGSVSGLSSSGQRSAPSTPARNGGSFSSKIIQPQTPSNSSSSSNDWRLKRPVPRSASSPTRKIMSNNSLIQRNIHQSNGSLHSDSHSSNSVSPAPSPSPRPNSATQTLLGKRWSSTGDFNNVPSPLQSNRFSTKSLLNLNAKLNSSFVKHGSSTATLIQRNDTEKSVKMFLRGRPVVHNVPEKYAATYDIAKVQPAPSKRLKMDWVYGYRGKDCRSNLYQLPTGEMVYFVAATVVLYNMDEQSQRHYLGHTDDVKSLAIHPNKLIIATGQCGGHDKKTASPNIRVWNSVSLVTMAVIGAGDFVGSVNCLSFSRADSGTLLCAIDDAPDKIISVWEWQRGETGHKITETKCSVDTIVAAEFHPLDRNQIVTAGKSHVAFWTLDQNGTLYKRMGIFETREKPKYITCITFNQAGDVLTGDSNGCITVWGRGTNTISKLIKKVHEGSIFSICALRNGGFISGGGKDGRLVLLQDDLKPSNVVHLIEPHFGAVRIIAQGKGVQLLVGTTRNCILTGDVELGFAPVVMGHTDEVWGLAVHPNMPQFVTGGYDRLLQLWDSLSHSVVWSKDIGEHIQSCTFSPEGDVIIVGAKTGKWFVFDTMTRELLAQYVDGAEPIQTMQFSPDGSVLAIGSRDNNIYLYQPSKDFRRFARSGKCSGHSSFILHLDFSMDGSIIRSNSGDYEVLYWNTTLCRQLTTQSATTDVEWATQNCVLSFETIGIWPESADGTDVNTVARSNDSKILATGDDFGKVNLYNFPAMQPKTLSHNYGGHSSHVTKVTFLHDDQRLISTGGADTSVLQWSIF